MTFTMRFDWIGLAALLCTSSAYAQTKAPTENTVNLDVPYVPTPQHVVNRMLQIAETGPNDIHYDLGSGDGRIVITAVRDFGVKKGIGVEIDPIRIMEANTNAQAAGVTDRVKFFQTDLFAFDFTEASVLTLYLLPDINLKLRPTILDKLTVGTRVVSHAFTMGDWRPDNQEVVEGEALYLWVVPQKIAGGWDWKTGQDSYHVDLMQQFQVITGTLRGPTGQAMLLNTVLRGDNLKFDASVQRDGNPVVFHFVGKANGNTLAGTVDFAGTQSAQITATRAK